MATDYPDYGGLQELQQFLTGLNLASTSLQASAAQIATALAAGGVPLLNGTSTLISKQGIVALPGGGTGYSTPISAPGYQVMVSGQCAVGSNLPYLGVQMRWKDSTDAFYLAEEDWSMPTSTSANNSVTYGRGPTKGGWLEFDVTNFDTGNNMTFSAVLVETTQDAARDDWRTTSLGPQPDINPAPGHPAAGVLMAIRNFSLVPGTAYSWRLPLYAGQVQLSILQSATHPIYIAVNTYEPFEQISNYLYQNTLTTPQLPTALLALPRQPAIVQLINNGTGAVTVDVAVTILEYAS